MKEYIRGFKTEFDGRLNKPIMNHEYDLPLVDHIIDVWKSLEIVDGIKIKKWTYTEEEQDLETDKYQRKRKAVAKATKGKVCKSIKDDRLGVLKLEIEITGNVIDPATKEKKRKKGIINKIMLLPIVENGYIQLKGRKFYLIYQMVDKSTYDNKDAVVLKSLMPVRVTRCSTTVVDAVDDSKVYKLPMYKLQVFKKMVNIILYYASRPGGLMGALDYLGVSNAIHIVDKIDDVDKNIYLLISSECFLEINKEIFNQSLYVRAISGMVCESLSNRFNYSMIYDNSIFLKKLSSTGDIEKGKDALTGLKRFLDVGTARTILTEDINKSDVYALLRWIMLEFNQLKAKDSNSLYNQRLRVNEYIASLLTIEFSNRLKKILKKGSNVVMTDLEDFFKFDSFLLIQKFHSSGILRFEDSINDMSKFFCKFRYTTKGPHSIGGKGTQGGRANSDIPLDKRWLHPSAVGLIDLTVCSSSDPGRSGVISPFSNLSSLYFSEELEPDDVMYNLNNKIDDILEKEDEIVIKLNCKDKMEFYDVLSKIDDVKNKCNVYVTSTDSIIIDNLGVVLDDDEKSQ